MTNPTAATLLQPGWGAPPKTKEQTMQEWIDAEKALKAAKDTEMELRKKVISLFPDLEAKEEGTVYTDLANGWRLKAVKKQNYNLKGDIEKALNNYENAAGTPEEKGRREVITERLVKWKPELSISEYREADKELLKVLESVLTITPGSPALELVAPK